MFRCNLWSPINQLKLTVSLERKEKGLLLNNMSQQSKEISTLQKDHPLMNKNKKWIQVMTILNKLPL